MMTKISLATSEKLQIINITKKIQDVITKEVGLLFISIPHTTAGLIINEDEENLKADMKEFYSMLSKGHWNHDRIDNNAGAHLAATTINNSLIVPISRRLLGLGTWQSILFVELDGPRDRNVHLMELSA